MEDYIKINDLYFDKYFGYLVIIKELNRFDIGYKIREEDDMKYLPYDLFYRFFAPNTKAGKILYGK